MVSPFVSDVDTSVLAGTCDDDSFASFGDDVLDDIDSLSLVVSVSCNIYWFLLLARVVCFLTMLKCNNTLQCTSVVRALRVNRIGFSCSGNRPIQRES